MYHTFMSAKSAPSPKSPRRPQLAFYGRDDIVGALARHLDSVSADGRGRLLAVRGRRQIGKSTVVDRFVRRSGTPYVYTVGTLGADARAQLDDATRAFGESERPLPGTAVLSTARLSSWREWLSAIEQAATDGPVIAVLDEFPWTIQSEPRVEGLLQNTWDRRLERLPVLMILIGSDVAMMERLNEYGRPLFGRVQPLVVDALNPAEIAQAMPGAEAVEVFDAYLVTGGYPRLVTDLARSGRDVRGYVHDACRDLYSPLVSTARFTLDAEFPDSPSAARVLESIGANDVATPRFNDLIPAGLDDTATRRIQTATTRALHVLADQKRLVEKETPAWAPDNGRLRRYRVGDPYLRFWFRYLSRGVEQIARGRSDLVTARFDRDWPSWRGRAIEPVARDSLLRLAPDLPGLADVERVSAWWTRDGQTEVDVAAASPERTVALGTIKWRPGGAVTARELSDLARARESVPRSRDARLLAVSPDGRAPATADLALSAQDLLRAWPV